MGLGRADLVGLHVISGNVVVGWGQGGVGVGNIGDRIT